MRKVTGLVLAGAAIAAPVMAQEWMTIGGTSATMAMPGVCAPAGTLVELSASAHRTVTQDRVRVTLSAVKDGKSAEEVQKAINTQMAAAKKIYDKAGKDTHVSTGGYNVWQQDMPETVDDNGVKTPRSTTWHGNQEVTLEAPADKAILKTVADLQGAGLAVQGMNYYLSREASDKLNDDLMVEALGTIGQRAQKIGKALDLPNMKYEEVSSGESGGGFAPMPMMAKAMMARDAVGSVPSPVGEAGESEVTLSVNAKVRLSK